MFISDSIKYIGVNDRRVDLFEGQYVVPNGISYNSYAILDDKIAIMDTVDAGFTHEWLDNLQNALGDRRPDYLIVQHMEPDHAANIHNFARTYPEAKIVASAKAFAMMKNFFGTDYPDRQVVVGEGDTLSLGAHQLTFVTAPMVHWPEVIVTYDSTDKVLFSADGFGKFGTPDTDEPWADEARRYFIGIVGKYGAQVQALLKKATGLDIQTICPLHGPVLNENLGYYLNLYNTWSSYQPEEEGIVIAYTSVYGNTKKAVQLLADRLTANGCPKVVVYDLARCDMAAAVGDAFRYSKPALTDYRVIDALGSRFSLVEAMPRTGRTHQIRVHLEHLGCPIVGDDKYFGRLKQKIDGIANKLYLHAYKIDLSGIYNGKKEICAPLPDHFKAALSALGLTLEK